MSTRTEINDFCPVIKDGTAGLHEKFMTGEEVPVLMGEVIGRKRS